MQIFLFFKTFSFFNLKVPERCPAGIGFGSGFNRVRKVDEEIEAGPLLNLVYGNSIVGVAVVVFSMIHPEADSVCVGHSII